MGLTDRYVTDAGAGDGTGSSEANAMSYATFTDYMSTGGSFTAAAGDRFNIKGAITARTTTTDTWLNGGTVTSPVIVRGYNSTIGDLTTLARTNGNGPLVTTNYPTISYTTGQTLLTGSNILVEALQISGSGTPAGTSVVRCTTGTGCTFKRCYFFSSSTNAAACAFSAAVVSNLIDSDVSLTGASGGNAAIITATNGVRIIGCRVTGGPAVGISLGTASTVLFNTIYSSTGIGIKTTSTSGPAIIAYNTVVGGGSDGINVITGTTAMFPIIGNMITDNTSSGVNMVSTANAAFASNNRFRDNGSTYSNAGDWLTATEYGDVTSGAGTSDYVNSGSHDYRLITASPAVDAGNPLYADIGALQRQEPASGGLLINPGLSGGLR